MPEGIKVIKIELPDHNEIEIVPFADVHIGDEWTDIQHVKDAIKYILEKPNRYVILNGDIMDMALTTSVSDTYAAKLNPMQQVNRAANLFRPLADAGRILAMGTGNHEDRVYKVSGVDVSAYLALELGLQDRYADNSFIVFIRFGRSKSYRPSSKNPRKNTYAIFCRHGHGGGRKKGAKLNAISDLPLMIEADLYISSHVHDVMQSPSDFFTTDYQNMNVTRNTRWFLISNSWQDFGGYGLKYSFNPASKQIGYAKLSGFGRKQIKVCIGI